MKSSPVAGSIDLEADQRDVVSRRKKKLTEKMRGFQLDEIERKWSHLHRKMARKTNTVRACFIPSRAQKLLGNSYNNLMISSE